jgi:hypothetical protein
MVHIGSVALVVELRRWPTLKKEGNNGRQRWRRLAGEATAYRQTAASHRAGGQQLTTTDTREREA